MLKQETALKQLKSMRMSSNYNGLIKSAIAQKQFLLIELFVARELVAVKRSVGKVGHLVAAARAHDQVKDYNRVWTPTDSKDANHHITLSINTLKDVEPKSTEGIRLTKFIKTLHAHAKAETEKLVAYMCGLMAGLCTGEDQTKTVEVMKDIQGRVYSIELKADLKQCGGKIAVFSDGTTKLIDEHEQSRECCFLINQLLDHILGIHMGFSSKEYEAVISHYASIDDLQVAQLGPVVDSFATFKSAYNIKDLARPRLTLICKDMQERAFSTPELCSLALISIPSVSLFSTRSQGFYITYIDPYNPLNFKFFIVEA